MARILIVEDNPEMRMMMMALLEANGHEVVESVDGVEALRWALEEQPDLIMLDVMMPVVDGWEVLQQLQGDHRTMDIPVIMVTAKKAQEDMDRAEELGASDYVAKPWSPGELETRVRWAVRKKAVPEFGGEFGLPAGFFDCGCPMRAGQSPEDHNAPDDCFGNQQTIVDEVVRSETG